MEAANTVLEYIKALIWPVLVLFLVLRYSKYLDRLLKRITEESDEITAKFLGINAKFSKDIAKLSSELQDEDSDREKIRETINAFARDQFRVLATNFYSQPLHIRTRVAKDIAELSKELPLNDLLEFSDSPLPGERVGAGIGLGSHLLLTPDLANDKQVIQAIMSGLEDAESRVRYRYIEALENSPNMALRLKDKLLLLSQSEGNDECRKQATKVLNNITA